MTLAALFREAGSAHHQAFAGTNGDDPDWPSWYSLYMGPRLEQLLGRPFEVQQLTQDLKAMDAQHRSGGGQEPWPEFYARWFRERYSL
jgi:hypothetical protein